MSCCYTRSVRAYDWSHSVGLTVFLAHDFWQSDSRLCIPNSSWVHLQLHHASTAVHRRSGWLRRRAFARCIVQKCVSAHPVILPCQIVNPSRPCASCVVQSELLGGAVSRMAGFPFQHTQHTNVTVMAAALTASILGHRTSNDGGGGSSGAGVGSLVRRAASLFDVVREAGSSGGDRLSFSVQLALGEELELLTALVSNRDVEWGDPVQAAAKQVVELVAGPNAAALHANLDEGHRTWWAEFWAKSSVHIETDRPAFDSGVHRFYYGALHVLASASRPGKVAPGLYGPWVTCDHMLWGDDFHLNYNFQAAFCEYHTSGPALRCVPASAPEPDTVLILLRRRCLGLQPTRAR